MFRSLRCLSLFTLLLSYPLMSNAQAIDHSVWDGLLKKHVQLINDGYSTVVDYAGFLQDRVHLGRYLSELSSIQKEFFYTLTKDEQLALLINTYNAWTVEFILTKYPDIDSIKELGSFFRSPWKKEFIPFLGKQRSLDDIEHNLIRGSDLYQDARIHFAVNCASIGCPALRAEAFIGSKLNAQLEQQTQLFLADTTRNRLDDNTLKVSSIFKWYREDFEKGWSGFESLEGFFALYSAALKLSDQQVLDLQEGDLDIEFLSYDWRLNKK